MPILTTPHLRRKRPGAAATAYSLALDVLRNPKEAELVTIHALRKGAHSRVGVVAHARHEALERAGNNIPTLPTETIAKDAKSFAQQLAGTRPAIERAVVSLESRYGFDSASFAESLGLTPDKADERAKETSEIWAKELDPAMMAWSGPGACEQLAAILAQNDLPLTSDDDTTLMTQTSEPTIQSLLNIAPIVSMHANECTICGERLRLLTPVRVLVGQTPLEHVPSRVARAALTSRHRLPAALPPSIDPRRFSKEKARRVAIGATGMGVAVLVFAIGFAIKNKDDETQSERVARLVQEAPTSRLLATPSLMNRDTNTASLANNGNEVILWHVTSSQPWLSISPENGRLSPNQSISLVVRQTGNPSLNDGVAVMTFTGSDGSTQTIRYNPLP